MNFFFECLEEQLDQLTEILSSLNLLIGRMDNNQSNVLSDQVRQPDLKLENALKDLNHLVFFDDRLHEQQLSFNTTWMKLREYIAAGSEEWRITNIHVIEQIHQRAHEINSLFEQEMERTLVDEPSEREKGTVNESWADMCMKTDNIYENISEEGTTEQEQNNEKDSSVRTEPIPVEKNPPAQNEPFPKTNMPALICSIPIHQINPGHLGLINQEQKKETITEIQNEKMNVENATNEESMDQQTAIDSEVTFIANQSAKNVGVTTTSAVTSIITPASTPSTSTSTLTSRAQSPIIQLNNTIPYSLERPGEFSLKSLLMYNKIMNELKKLPKFSAEPKSFEFRAMRNFITEIVKSVNQIKIKWSHVEPFLMGQVISVFPSQVLTQWALNTAQGPTTFMKLREFLANYEELLSQGFVEQIQNTAAAYSTPPINQEQNKTYASILGNKAGAIPKKVASSRDEWEDDLPLALSPPRTQPELNPNRHAPRWEQNKYDWDLVGNNNKNNKRTNTYPPNQTSKRANTLGIQNYNSSSSPELGYLNCLGCYQTGHLMFKCPEFLGMSFEERQKVVRKRQICPLCLNSHHKIIQCTKGPCKRCTPSKPHNSTLCPTGMQER